MPPGRDPAVQHVGAEDERDGDRRRQRPRLKLGQFPLGDQLARQRFGGRPGSGPGGGCAGPAVVVGEQTAVAPAGRETPRRNAGSLGAGQVANGVADADSASAAVSQAAIEGREAGEVVLRLGIVAVLPPVVDVEQDELLQQRRGPSGRRRGSPRCAAAARPSRPPRSGCTAR